MHGQNEVSAPFNASGEVLTINEVFYTLQGEGPDSGRPAIFVRLAKCNLRCFFCDTEFEKGDDYPLHKLVDDVLTLAREHGCRLVVITGGEPLLQNIVPFVKRMNEFGVSCSVETAGTVMLPDLHEVFDPMRSIRSNLIVCSPKTPKIHPQIERLVGAWKYVVNHLDGPENHGLPTRSTQRQDLRVNVFVPIHPVVEIWVSPMDEEQHGPNERNRLHARDVALKHGYRLSLQVHKLVGIR